MFIFSHFKEQYVMIHIALIDYYLFRNTLFKKQTCKNEYKKLTEIESSKSKTKLAIQFDVIFKINFINLTFN